MPQLFGHVRKQLDEKDKINFKINDVTTWFTNNCNAHIAQYLTNNQAMKFGQLIKYNMRNIFLQNYAENEAGRLVPDRFLSFQKA